MALLNKIRERSGLAVGIIAFGLILFLLGADFLSPSSVLFNRNNVGEIDGVTITPERYNQAIDQQERDYTARTGQRPPAEQSRQIRDFAWRKLVADIAYNNQYQELGVTVTPDERYDIVQGNNISEDVKGLFRNPQTGEFDRESLTNFFQNYNQYTPEQRLQWQSIENTLADARQRIKYESLITETSYVTFAEAKNAYEQQNSVAEARYLYVPYYSIADSAVQITESDLRAYFNKNQEQFRIEEETRGLSYVMFPIIASELDSAAIYQRLEVLVDDFAKAEDDSAFARRNSITRENFYSKATMADMTPALADQASQLEEGQVIGPVLENEAYALYKVSEIGEDTTSVARASHILIRADGTDDAAKAEAREQAEDLIRRIRNGESFADLAAEFGTDGTAQQGGDLGWFDERTMVPEFSDAVFGRSTTGLISQPVETQFGFHVIEVTEAPTNTYYQLARIDAEIVASTATNDQIYREADMLRNAAGSSLSGLEEAVNTQGYPLLAANNVSANADRFNAVRDARGIVRWMFNEASPGDVAQEIFQVEGAYVVAALANVREKGIPSMASVEPQIRAEVRKQKKAAAIKATLGDTQNATLDDLAAKFGSDASINTSANLRANSNSMTGIGFAPKALGVTFGLQEGQISQPVEETNGIVVIELQAITPATQQNSYEANRTSLANQRQAANRGAISNAIEKHADIEDKRFRVE